MKTNKMKSALLVVLPWSLLAFASIHAQEFEREPIEYSKRSGDNRVTQLVAELQSGKKTLKHEPGFGYLRSLLAETARVKMSTSCWATTAVNAAVTTSMSSPMVSAVIMHIDTTAISKNRAWS